MHDLIIFQDLYLEILKLQTFHHLVETTTLMEIMETPIMDLTQAMEMTLMEVLEMEIMVLTMEEVEEETVLVGMILVVLVLMSSRMVLTISLVDKEAMEAMMSLTTTLILVLRAMMSTVTTLELVTMVRFFFFPENMLPLSVSAMSMVTSIYQSITKIYCKLFLFSVSVHCKDTRIVVNVGTNKPFSGRIYALGRSETCNVDVINR